MCPTAVTKKSPAPRRLPKPYVSFSLVLDSNHGQRRARIQAQWTTPKFNYDVGRVQYPRDVPSGVLASSHSVEGYCTTTVQPKVLSEASGHSPKISRSRSTKKSSPHSSYPSAGSRSHVPIEAAGVTTGIPIPTIIGANTKCKALASIGTSTPSAAEAPTDTSAKFLFYGHYPMRSMAR